jgi:hypothetical protein
MMPTELLPAAVAMLADASPQLLYLDNKFFMRHLVKVGVHGVLPIEPRLRKLLTAQPGL